MRRILWAIRKAISDEALINPEAILISCLTKDAALTIRELRLNEKGFSEHQIWDAYVEMFLYETAKSDLHFEELPQRTFRLRERLRNPPRPGPKYAMNGEQVDLMRKRRREGMTVRALASEFGVHYSTIWRSL